MPYFDLAHLAILAVALVVGFVDQRLWAQSRILTTASLFLFLFVAPSLFDLIRIPQGVPQPVALTMALIGLGWISVYTLGVVRSWIDKKARPLPESHV